MMRGSKLALIIAGMGKKAKKPEDEFSEEDDALMASSSGGDGDDDDDPVDLFLESIGVEPSKNARRAFKLAVRSCYEEE